MATLVLVIIFGTIYSVVQQSQRTDANWPQIQLAEDASALLNKNQPPRMFSGTYVDIGTSLATFTNVYDLSGQPVTGSGYLKSSLATVPKGILTAADGRPYHSVTWEPATGVRIAAVTVKANGYYVLSGRSLTEVEKNESKTFLLSFVGGLLSLAVVVTYIALKSPAITLRLIKTKKKQSKEDTQE
ncbi:MAG: hypothetical protein JWO07_77 [Candidatus Saccharibacteria bacterium]|nr:hypothetical protein [Candidatus Saccharibacteria bacterium]